MKKNNVAFALKSLVNYLASVALAVIFALFLSGRIGWFLVIAFICAPVVSGLITFICSKRIYVDVSSDKSTLSKNESFGIDVNVSNDLFLPSPNVMIDMTDHPCIRCDEKRFSVSVMPYATESFTAIYSARLCGPCEIGVERIVVTDYFGLFSFPVRSDAVFQRVSVIPEIGEISEDDEMLRRVTELSAEADDSEDTSEGSAFTFGGFPGYDTREYVPGDPLKRINWKQSVRRGRLLVRTDDEKASSGVAVVLDSVFMSQTILPALYLQLDEFNGISEDELVPVISQYAVENAIGYANGLMKAGFAVSFMFYGHEGWEIYRIADEKDVSQLRTSLASYSFRTDAELVRLPSDKLGDMKGTVALYCTPHVDKALYELMSSSEAISRTDEKIVLYGVTRSVHVTSDERKGRV